MHETRLSPEQVQFFEEQLAKMDQLELTPEAIEVLELDFQRLSRAQELIALAEALAGGVSGEDGAQVRVARLVREARQLEALDPASKALADRLASASVELADLGAEFAGLSQQLVFEPDQAEQLQTRMSAWLDLKRRHGGGVGAVLTARAEIRRRLDVQGDLEGALIRLDKQIAEAGKAARKQAEALPVGARARRRANWERREPGRSPRSDSRIRITVHWPTLPNGPDRRLWVRVSLLAERRRGAAAARSHCLSGELRG